MRSSRRDDTYRTLGYHARAFISVSLQGTTVGRQGPKSQHIGNDRSRTVGMNSSNNHNWTISTSRNKSSPHLTSPTCYESLVHFFSDNSSDTLALATESSSHVSGLDSVFAQPWVYAGGGLGNIDECPIQVCLAGGTGRDSLTFASFCLVEECTAADLAAPDFSNRLETAAFQDSYHSYLTHIQEYVELYNRIAEVNRFLGTGWICGTYTPEWLNFPAAAYLLAVCGCLFCSVVGTFYRKRNDYESIRGRESTALVEEKKEIVDDELSENGTHPQSHHELIANHQPKKVDSFWSSWDMNHHIKRICQMRGETACLDGLKVVSMLWVITGHVFAIQSSSGPGFINPRSFLPPDGVSTTLAGQLLFSSRFAVDTFLCVSGFLVVTTLEKKLDRNLRSVFGALALRIIRIMPLYLACLCFWVLIAPHLGSGPFWYQWRALLAPCQKFWWTNVIFVNNLLPSGTPTTDTCFYHSWYIAVDVQLFCLLAPWLVLLSRSSRSTALRVTLVLWIASVALTAFLTYSRRWSINTFDGLSVALFDIEGYSKPYVRAQSYLAGMYAAMAPRALPNPSLDKLAILCSIILLSIISLVTVTGAYARRPCNFGEEPLLDDCGSLWAPSVTFAYTGFSRALWSICVGKIIYLCIHKRGYTLGTILSFRLLSPLSRLSFGAYLVHPIIIFVWQLGEKEKITFRWFSFFMDVTAVSILSFLASALITVVIETPINEIQRQYLNSKNGQNMESELRPLRKYSSPYGSFPDVLHFHGK